MIVAVVVSVSLFPRVSNAEDSEPQYVFPFSKVPVRYPKDHLTMVFAISSHTWGASRS
jgi:hypothetical protein